MNAEGGQARREIDAVPARDLQCSQSPSGVAASKDLGASWERCASLYGLDPVDSRGPDILSQSEICLLRSPLESTLATAREELDRLQTMVRQIGYATLLADPGGVIIERYCRSADAETFNHYGTRPGAVWAEQAEGTNGIGTCIVEQRPLSVHRHQHFRRRYVDLSCSAAPIFDAGGRLKAVLNVASHATEVSDRSHALALAIAVESARAIEERDFRESNRRNWVLALRLDDDGDPGVMLAVDAEHYVLAADRHARSAFALDDARIGSGIHLRQVFERYPLLRKGRSSDDFVVALSQIGGTAWQGLITPPEVSSMAWFSGTQVMLHTRPRPAVFCGVHPQMQTWSPCCGLPPRLLLRVRQHIESNLEKSIPVEELAAMAGLSVAHFSRAFKKSAGLSPHQYLTQQRLDKAAQLLIGSRLSLAEIAQAVGFCDQSHFTRCFSRHIRSTPSVYRHALR